MGTTTKFQNLSTKSRSILENYVANSPFLNDFTNQAYSADLPYKYIANDAKNLDNEITKLFLEYGANGFQFLLNYVAILKNQTNKTLEFIWSNSKEKDITTTNQYYNTNTYQNVFDTIEQPGGSVSPSTIKLAASSRINLGQVLGPEFGKANANANNNGFFQISFAELSRGFSTGKFTFQDFISYAESVSNPINSKKYNPAFIRDQRSTLERESFDTLIGQNLLLPTGDNGNTSTVFNNLYTNNRSRSNQFPEGIISGTNVLAIQEPDPSGNKAFNFSDDAIYYNADRNDRGFSSNINADSTAANPAVVHSQASLFGNKDDLESVGLANQQVFPFLFETENRRGKDIKQYCLLQSTMGSLQESYRPVWASKQFYGRTEEIHTYTNTSRNIDLNFVIASMSLRELQNTYERITWLAQQCYGQFDTSDGAINRIKTGPLIRMTMGDLFSRIPGYIETLSYNWDYGGQGGKWELTRGIRMPVMLQITMGFHVIHNNLPDRNFNFYWGLESGMSNRKEGNLIPTSRYNANSVVGTGKESYVDLLKRVG